jgi:hypothetical protein
MTLNANNVRVPYTGAARVAPVGTTAPTASTGVFGAGWADLGYISEDGITETPNADWQEIRAWQGRTVVRRTLTSSDVQWQFRLIEQKLEVLELYYSSSQVQDVAAGDARIDIVAPGWDPRAFAIDLIDGAVHERIIIPQATVTDRGEITYNGVDEISYDVTITALPSGLVDADGRPIYATKWSDNPAWATVSSS